MFHRKIGENKGFKQGFQNGEWLTSKTCSSRILVPKTVMPSVLMAAPSPLASVFFTFLLQSTIMVTLFFSTLMATRCHLMTNTQAIIHVPTLGMTEIPWNGSFNPNMLMEKTVWRKRSLITHFPSARLIERNRGYSSGAGFPCWSSYRKMGERPTSTPSCWMPCWLYMDSRKDCRPDLGLTVNMMEKSSGKTPPGKGHPVTFH